ncbi:alpha/beta hydrolase [Lactobacillus sp. UCMA15818]|uniref:alpha/beta hydrolase n=1 Tax=Lactobacillus sp. UCMA15818 TaxID=2583394 RepID=UPI0025B1FF83|nr:alpha/beta hydrolase [Lactobacillus sp. UCMA15818]MDN2452170.1 alpha/beta hydrolase [Lactobacillus sp. UCMA15818]
MKHFKLNIGKNGGYAEFYLQEQDFEIDPARKFPTIVICPGGVFMWTSSREGEPIAQRFLAEGFHCVIVHYATEGIKAYQTDRVEKLPQSPVSKFPNPVVEVAQVLVYLRENSDQFAVAKDQITVMGFSAGGTVAAWLGVFWNTKWLAEKVQKKNDFFKPNSLMLGYPALDVSLKSDRKFHTSQPQKSPKGVIIAAYAATGEIHPEQAELDRMNPRKYVSKDMPPTFIWHTQEDPLVPVYNSLWFAEALEKQKIPVELHVFSKGKHGLALGDYRTGIKQNQTSAQIYKWVDLFLEWLYPYKTIRGSFYRGL